MKRSLSPKNFCLEDYFYLVDLVWINLWWGRELNLVGELYWGGFVLIWKGDMQIFGFSGESPTSLQYGNPVHL